jgi:chromosome segregation ATPase
MLDERIEALTQSVDVLASMHKDTETRFTQLAAAVEMNEQRTGQFMETMNRVGRILEIHDSQIDDHDQRIDRLERPGA